MTATDILLQGAVGTIAGALIGALTAGTLGYYVTKRRDEAIRREEVKALLLALLAEIDASLWHLQNRKRYIEKCHNPSESDVEFDCEVTRLPEYKIYSQVAHQLGLLADAESEGLAFEVVTHYTGLTAQATVLAKGKYEYAKLMKSLDMRIDRGKSLSNELRNLMISKFKISVPNLEEGVVEEQISAGRDDA